MKTVVENNADIYRRECPSYVEKVNPFIPNTKEKSCFYDFGARSSVEFSGFVDFGDSAFIDEIGEIFKNK